MLTVAIPKRNKLQNIIVLTPKDGYIGQSGQRGESIWETNIFGKSIEQLVRDGIRNKLASIGEESQVKLQDTMQKIVNDSKGGMVCIII